MHTHLRHIALLAAILIYAALPASAQTNLSCNAQCVNINLENYNYGYYMGSNEWLYPFNILSHFYYVGQSVNADSVCYYPTSNKIRIKGCVVAWVDSLIIRQRACLIICDIQPTKSELAIDSSKYQPGNLKQIGYQITSFCEIQTDSNGCFDILFDIKKNRALIISSRVLNDNTLGVSTSVGNVLYKLERIPEEIPNCTE